jgi:flavin reductase (DIM6/NTAB) family NADH-FMN oxidoreductase RutF
MPEGVPVEIVNQVLWRIPNVLCLIGAAAAEEWNGMTASWVTQVAMEPVLVAVAIDRASVTHRLIVEGRCFSVNLWSRDDTRIFVGFSKPARREGGSLNGRPVRLGVTGAPIFTEAIAYLDCRLWQSLDCGTHTLFVGEVADCGFQGDGEGKPVARIEDTRMKYGGVKRRGAGH